MALGQRGFGSQTGLLCVGASRWQQRLAAPGSPARSLATNGCTAPAKSPLLCHCSSRSCVGLAALRAGACSGAQSQELKAVHSALKQTPHFQRREKQAGEQGGWWPVPGSLSWDSELSCCVSGAKSGSVSSVCPGYHIKNSGTVRVSQQRVECTKEGDNNCAGRWVQPPSDWGHGGWVILGLAP